MRRTKIIIFVLLVLIILVLFSFGVKSGIDIEQFQQSIKNMGILAPFLFVLIYSLGPTFFVPITPLSVTGGVLFGPILGTVYTVIVYSGFTHSKFRTRMNSTSFSYVIVISSIEIALDSVS